MPIVYCSLELHLPECHSLKEKRSVMQKAAGRLRSRFNFSISELDHQDVWQRGRLGAVSIGPDRRKLERIAEEFVAESERVLGGDLVRCQIEFFEHD